MRNHLFASVLLFTAVVAQAQQPEWSVSFGSFSQVAGLDVTRDGAALLAYTSTPCEKVMAPRDEPAFMNRLAVAKVDRSGKTVFDVEIRRPSGVGEPRGGPSMGTIGGLAALDDGDFIVFAEFVEGQPWMLRFDGEGKPVFAKELVREGRHTITSVLRVGEDVVVGGHAEGDFYVARYASSGRVVWEKVIDNGDIDVVVDLAADPETGIVAVGMSLPADLQRAMVAGSVSVFRFDDTGKLAAETHFPGRFPNVAVSPASIAVVYDRGEGLEVSVRMRTFSRSLAQSAEVGVPAAGPQATINAAPDGGFVIAALGETKPVVLSMSPTGARRAAADITLPTAAEYRLAWDGTGLYVVGNEIGVREEGRTCIRVRLTRVAAVR